MHKSRLKDYTERKMILATLNISSLIRSCFVSSCPLMSNTVRMNISNDFVASKVYMGQGWLE